jgi:predicted O-methyltransferase YrrM
MNVYSILWPMLLVFPLFSFSQTGDSLYQGIDDPVVLPMLKTLYGKPSHWNVPPQDGRFLYDLVTKKGYKRGLEIGTSNGYSTLWLGLAFRKNGGKLITIEIDRGRASEARENFRQAGLADVVDSRLNDALAEIPKISGGFDFVFIDANKPDYKRYFDLLYPRVLPGGVITAHNVTDLASGMENFLEAIQKNPNLQTTIERTSEAGISVSIKKK